MALNETRTKASRDQVWEVLADGWRYTNWVVGASHMRAVSGSWPSVGAQLHHAAGIWPALLKDETVVEEMDQGRRLVLTASGRPLGKARIVLELEDDPTGCLIRMHESPVAGPGKWVDNPVAEAFIQRRNDESLSRLTALVERRTEPEE